MINHLKKIVSNFKRKKKYTAFYRKFIKASDLCFDIGANIGSRTEVFLNLGAKVVSVEPVEETFAILKSNFRNSKNVTLLKLGVGSKEGQEELYLSTISEVCTFSKLFIEKHKVQEDLSINWHSSRSVKIKTLDQLIENFGVPDFCKIDVEGYELEVLKGLSQPLPLISFEYNTKLKKIALECINIMSKFDSLSYNFSAFESMLFSFSTWKNTADFALFIKDLPAEIKTGDIYVKHN